jgi:hypothetical protein
MKKIRKLSRDVAASKGFALYVEYAHSIRRDERVERSSIGALEHERFVGFIFPHKSLRKGFTTQRH